MLAASYFSFHKSTLCGVCVDNMVWDLASKTNACVPGILFGNTPSVVFVCCMLMIAPAADVHLYIFHNVRESYNLWHSGFCFKLPTSSTLYWVDIDIYELSNTSHHIRLFPRALGARILSLFLLSCWFPDIIWWARRMWSDTRGLSSLVVAWLQ